MIEFLNIYLNYFYFHFRKKKKLESESSIFFFNITWMSIQYSSSKYVMIPTFILRTLSTTYYSSSHHWAHQLFSVHVRHLAEPWPARLPAVTFTVAVAQWTKISLVPDFRFIRSLNLHAGAFLESLVTFVRAGVGLSHVTIAHINWYYIIILYVSNCSMKC